MLLFHLMEDIAVDLILISSKMSWVSFSLIAFFKTIFWIVKDYGILFKFQEQCLLTIPPNDATRKEKFILRLQNILSENISAVILPVLVVIDISLYENQKFLVSEDRANVIVSIHQFLVLLGLRQISNVIILRVLRKEANELFGSNLKDFLKSYLERNKKLYHHIYSLDTKLRIFEVIFYPLKF